MKATEMKLKVKHQQQIKDLKKKHESKLQTLKEEVEKLEVFGAVVDHEWHDVVRLDKIRNLITNLDDK